MAEVATRSIEKCMKLYKYRGKIKITVSICITWQRELPKHHDKNNNFLSSF